jgi:DNA-binding GntR family transcriptional regulator
MGSERAALQHVTIRNLRDQVEGQVRDAILNGVFRPGERLVETTLADQLGVSRAPLREVLSALERDGLVVSIPRRGCFVIDFTDKDIEEIYSLRLLVEVAALRRAIACCMPEDVAELQEMVDRLGDLVTAGDNPGEVVHLDMLFHEKFCRLANHGRMYSVWNSMSLQTRLLMGLTSKTRYDRPTQPRDFHQGILDAVKAGDLQTAEALLTAHIEDAERRAREAMRMLRPVSTETLN